jgi:hypothetical protein
MHQGSLLLPPIPHCESEVHGAPNPPVPGTTHVDVPMPQYSPDDVQSEQATPPAPQLVSLSLGGGHVVVVKQVLPLQQPLHVPGPQPALVHTPLKQVCEPLQGTHALPPDPH